MSDTQLGIPGVPAPQRPTAENSKKVRIKAVDKVLPKVLAWIRTEDPHVEEGEVQQDLLEAIFEHAVGTDGYELAKILEDQRGYIPDAQLVEILEGVDGAVHSSEQDAIKDWVKNNDIKIPFAIGDCVVTNRAFDKGKQGRIDVLLVVSAQVGVHFPHMPKGQSKLYNVEDLLPCAEQE